MTVSSRLRRDGSAKRYEQHTDSDGESDEDGQFPGQEEHAVHSTCKKENLSPRECDAQSFAQVPGAYDGIGPIIH